MNVRFKVADAMFTGLVRDVGTVVRAEGDPQAGLRMTIGTSLDAARMDIGASVACAGVCLTVVDTGADRFSVDVSPETLDKTLIGYWAEGVRVNLEPSLRAGDEMGGHMVSGHVDGLVEIEALEEDGDYHCLRFRAPKGLARFIAPKGSVALDGVSLTVNVVRGEVFDIMLIPHTWAHTTFMDRVAGDRVHIEIDMLARYAARILEYGCR